MEIVSDIQRQLRDLKEESQEIQKCLTDNSCMSKGCPKGKIPAVCLTDKDRIEVEIKLKNKEIPSDESDSWMGQYTLDNSNPPR